MCSYTSSQLFYRFFWHYCTIYQLHYSSNWILYFNCHVQVWKILSKAIVTCCCLTDVSVSYSGREIDAFCLLKRNQLLEYWYEQAMFLSQLSSYCKQLSSIHFFGFQVAMVIWGKELYSYLDSWLAVLTIYSMDSIQSCTHSDCVHNFDTYSCNGFIWLCSRMGTWEICPSNVRVMHVMCWIKSCIIFILYSTSLVGGYVIYYAQLFFIKYAFVSKVEGQKKPFYMFRQNSKKLVVCSVV